jgi:hypothetical protein
MRSDFSLRPRSEPAITFPLCALSFKVIIHAHELVESQKLINVLHGLSLLAGDRKAAKRDELKARYQGAQIKQLRLFDSTDFALSRWHLFL